MGGRVITEKDAVEFTKIFLTTEFEGGRHQRRIDQIAAIEQRKPIKEAVIFSDDSFFMPVFKKRLICFVIVWLFCNCCVE